MRYAADLHLHSPFARATSRQLTFDNMAQWARVKGIDLLASADFTHPAWFADAKRTLRPMDNGLYEHNGARFVIGTEVNCSGAQGGRHRRVHMLMFAPDIPTAERINKALDGKGNLAADGRPTLHMTPRDLLALLLDIDERIMLIPAHAWTPHFGIYGSKSGFDSLAECFGYLTPHIYAIETGLSSDPAMNWRIPELDGVSIVSFSDAHSLPKMGRELTIIEGELSYEGLRQSLRQQRIAYTVEFFPEEGKYHNSGHRKCGVNMSPRQARGGERRLSHVRQAAYAGRAAARRRAGAAASGRRRGRHRFGAWRGCQTAVQVAGGLAADSRRKHRARREY